MVVQTNDYGDTSNGEIRIFRIFLNAHDALVEGGLLLLEPQTYDAVRRTGEGGARWYSAREGLFSSRPHLCLMENFWNDQQHVAVERFYVVDAASGAVQRYAASTQAYRRQEYLQRLEESGFTQMHMYPSLLGDVDVEQDDLMVLVARKGEK